MTFETVEELLGHPGRWPHLGEAELVQLVSLGSWLAALKDDATLEERFESLYAHVVENVDAGTRRQVVAHLGELLESFGREHGTCPVNVLRHWLLSDPDFGVVSTAALVAAQTMPLFDEDPLTGPRLVLGLALEATEADRQGAIVTGLAALGDADVLALVGEAWDALDGDAKGGVLQRMGHGTPTIAAIDFLVSRLECPTDEDDGAVGHLVGSLVRLRRAADRGSIGGQIGVPEIERRFPSWGGAEGDSPIVVRRMHAPQRVGERIGTRLQHAAATEEYPRLLPLAMRAWGVEDTAFVEGLRQAVVASSGETRPGRLLDVPVPVEPMPDWDRDDAVLTWGIVNPFGPTKVQICRTRVEDATDALVYTLHNPFGPVCLLLGTIVTGDTASTARLLLELANRFHIGEHVLIKGLPHWLVLSADAVLDVAAFFRAAHAAALERDLATDDNLEELMASLHRLRLNAPEEVHRQLREAMEAFGSGGNTSSRGNVVPASNEAYKRWLAVVGDPEHVEAVSTHFLDCWSAALRRQQTAESSGADDVRFAVSEE
jgi:hypothetical protein